MSRVSFFLWLCVMTLAVVVQGVPNDAEHPDAQCARHRHRASCDNLIWGRNRELNCANIQCADRNNEAVSIGRAADGTVCNDNKICIAGICSNLPRGQRMPNVIGRNPYVFMCTIVPPSRTRG